MIESFPCIIIICSLPHKRIRHRKPTKTRIIQIAQRMRRNFRNKLLHHRRPCQFLRSHCHRHFLNHFFLKTTKNTTTTTPSVQNRSLIKTSSSTTTMRTSTVAGILSALRPHRFWSVSQTSGSDGEKTTD